MNINSLPSFPLSRFLQPGQQLSNGVTHKHHHGHHRAIDETKGQLNQLASNKSADQNMLATLEKTLQANGVSLAGLESENFTPEKVAGRLLDFAEKVSRDNPEQLKKIKKGLQQGFKEARKILDGMGLFKGEIKQNFDATQDLVKQGLKRLSNEHIIAPRTTEMQFKALSESLKQSTAIEIETKEGDIVTIEINRVASHQQSAFQMQGSNRSLSIFHESSTMQSNLNFTVQGDLSEEEQQEIEMLLAKVEDISTAFFDGDMQAAFSKAQNIGFNMEQISEFSVDLNSERNVTAVSAYQKIDEFAETDSVIEPSSTNEQLQHAVDFLKKAQEMLADSVSVLDAFANPKSAFADIFTGIEQSIVAGLPEIENDIVASDELVDHLTHSMIDESPEG